MDASRGVCLFVCQFVAVRIHCTKISPEFEVKVKGQRSRSPGQKSATLCSGVVLGSSCGIFSGAVLEDGSSTPVGKSAHAVKLHIRFELQQAHLNVKYCKALTARPQPKRH